MSKYNQLVILEQWINNNSKITGNTTSERKILNGILDLYTIYTKLRKNISQSNRYVARTKEPNLNSKEIYQYEVKLEYLPRLSSKL